MQFDIYCDESRQDLLVSKDSITDNNRYVCFGGLIVPLEKRDNLKKEINNLKKKYCINNEFKWGNVSKNKMNFYLELIDLFFDADNADIEFRCVVIDAIEVDDEKHNDSDHELGYYKFYYQLLYHWIDINNNYYIFTDFKTNKDRKRLHELRRITNLGKRKECVDILQAINSKESAILQLQNILMGAVAYKYNFGAVGKSEAKNEVIKHVEKYLKHDIMPTTKNCRKFNVFKISLKGGM